MELEELYKHLYRVQQRPKHNPEKAESDRLLVYLIPCTVVAYDHESA